MKILLSHLFFITILLSSCVYNIEEDLYPTIDCNNTDFDYKSAVISIFENNCYVCHSEAANVGRVNFESYDFVENGSLIGAISHSPNYTAMP